MTPLLSLLTRAGRGLRENLPLHVVSAGVIATSLTLLGVFLLVEVNLRGLTGTWAGDMQVSAYFRDGIDDGTRTSVQTMVAARPEVAKVEYVSEADALAWLSTRSPELSPVLDELGTGALPASLEITLRTEATTPDALAAFVSTLKQTRAFDDVDDGREWVARMASFLSLLRALGVALGLVISVATLYLVANTVHLVVHARRDELAVMRLVGATEGFILGPFLVEGAATGLVGGAVALAALSLVHRGLQSGAQVLFAAALGPGGVVFLGTPWSVGLLVLGAGLGALATWGAVRRFLAGLP